MCASHALCKSWEVHVCDVLYVCIFVVLILGMCGVGVHVLVVLKVYVCESYVLSVVLRVCARASVMPGGGG